MNNVHGRTHFELEQFIDLTKFDAIQLDIIKGIATAKPLSQHGYLPPFLIYDPAELSEELRVEPLMKSYQTYRALSDSDLIKRTGEEIKQQHGYNALTTFLKYIYGAHDLYSHYLFWDHFKGWRSNVNHRELTPITEHFSTLIQWIDSLVTDNIFSNIGRAYLIAIESNGYSFEHRDPPLDPDVDASVFPEFIHIRPSIDRPFYVYDSESKQKHYINSRIGWWNDRDIHGGEPAGAPSYAVRIDGIFSDNFRKRIGL